MRIVLFTNFPAALAAICKVKLPGELKAVVVSADKAALQNAQTRQICNDMGIAFLQVDKNSLHKAVEQLLAHVQPDVAIMFGFSYRIPPQIYSLPPMGFYNIHFSLLPAYRGPDPVFHQLKNGEQTSGVTIHKVDEHFDTGEIVLQQLLQLIPGETWGLCFSRHIPLAVGMINELIIKLKDGPFLPSVVQDMRQASYHKRLDIGDTAINWSMQTAAQIDRLVNACNPAVGGAMTFYKLQPLRIVEVSQVDGQSEHDVQPGTIIYAGPEGLFVQCLGLQVLRVNILSINEGVISGAKFGALGACRGDRFENSDVYEQLRVN